jgi:predicted Holliday junction resolvase-like endonuclease
MGVRVDEVGRLGREAGAVVGHEDAALQAFDREALCFGPRELRFLGQIDQSLINGMQHGTLARLVSLYQKVLEGKGRVAVRRAPCF